MNKLLAEWRCFWFFVGLRIDKIKRSIWNRGIKLWWYRLWIRKDEFHYSLDIDVCAMIGIKEREVDKYFNDLIKRRRIACRRELEKPF